MPEIDPHTEILEDHEPLLELRDAHDAGDWAAFHGVLRELRNGHELTSLYHGRRLFSS